jgi:hypothetical protein
MYIHVNVLIYTYRRIIQLQMERLSIARDEVEGSPRVISLDEQVTCLCIIILDL